MFLLGIFYAFVGIVLAWITPFTDSSLAAVFLTTMAAIPFLVAELKKEESEIKRKPLIGDHKDIVGIFFFLFLGILTTYILSAILLPADVYNTILSAQSGEINRVAGIFSSTGAAVANCGESPWSMFYCFMANNTSVLFFCLIFSFIFGAGAIFLLAWNASTLGVAIGTTIRNYIPLTGHLQAINIGLGRYLVHGIPEMIAYLLAAIAGGIISAAFVRHEYRSPKFFSVLKDSIGLIMVSLLLLVVSAIIEIGLMM
jgi:uncharacterized membrane protein SpoIIM required for sporulation